ncbi:unnamed protein product [Arabis nemorensis]|uniref:CCHC-type domain-containing protein n=1 Tax=Arabis nemorensis TaxID=586526 RepID=A0A565AS20_9BRAS|nr:unnamed protein product [Arabis nemorensis]
MGGGRIDAPPYKSPPGRPKRKARIKGLQESPPKKKVSRVGKKAHCGLCSEKGHNSRKCPDESSESRAKRKRLNKQAREKIQMKAQIEVNIFFSTAPQGSQLARLLFG